MSDVLGKQASSPKHTPKQSAPCVYLPQDIFQMILQKLQRKSDLRDSRQVCRSWRDAVDTAFASKSRSSSASQFAGLLLVYTYNSSGRFYFRDFKDASFVTIDQNLNLFKSPVLAFTLGSNYLNKSRRRRSLCWVVGSIGGWLIMTDQLTYNYHCLSDQRYNHYLLNPISGTRVMLPRQYSNKNFEPHFVKVVASSSKPSLDCILAGQLSSSELVALCRLSDTSWTLTDHKATDIEIADGKLYALMGKHWSQQVVMFDIMQHDDDDLKLVELSKLPLCFGGKKRETYLVKDSTTNEVFVLCRDVGLADCGGMKTVGFQLLKVDGLNNELEEVDDTGDRILFSSDESNMFVPLSGSSHNKLERNCIYFAFLEYYWEFGIYSLSEKKTINPLDFQHPFPHTLASRSRSLWFTPLDSLLGRKKN